MANDSTLLYWRNGTGFVSNTTLRQYGLFIWDWAHGAKRWINDYQPMDNGAVLQEQCRRAKLVNPSAKCIVYRNTVKALNQFASVSAVLDDAAYAGFFLRWKPGATHTGSCDLRTPGGPPLMPNPQVECRNLTRSDVHVPMCDGANRTKCSSRFYFGMHQLPLVPGHNWAGNTTHPFENLTCTTGQCDCGRNPCGEYLFDLRNKTMRKWFVEDYMGAALAPPFVDGLILDDSWTLGAGPSEEDRHSLGDTGFSPDDVGALVAGWQAARSALEAHADSLHKYIAPTYGGDALSWRKHAPMNSTELCAQKLRAFCRPGAPPAAPHYFSVAYDKVQPPTFGLAAVNLDLDMAYYLVARGVYAWVGSGPILGWQLSHWWARGKTRLIEPSDFRPHWFDAEFGEPLQGCFETAPGVSGVFRRRWTKVTATVDCNAIAGDIRPPVNRTL